MSVTIDREGIGESPVGGSKFTHVDSIPRGIPQFGFREVLCEGKPACPSCGSTSDKHVVSNGRRFSSKSSCKWGECDMHCNKCRVCWRDSEFQKCYTCEAVFKRVAAPYWLTSSGPYKGRPDTLGHLNVTTSPCCEPCAVKLAGKLPIHGSTCSVVHSRRQLRRLAGLR